MAPAFALAGSRAASLFVAALVAIGTAYVWRTAYLLTGSAAAAWFGWSMLTLALPASLMGALLYPDGLAGAAIAVAIWSAMGGRRGGSPFVAGLMIGCLPWLHPRLAIPAGALLIVVALRMWKESAPGGLRRSMLALLVPVMVSGAGWLTYFWVAFGSIDPRAPFGGHVPIDIHHTFNGVVGLLADQEFGLLPNAPVFLTSVAALLTLARRDARLLAEMALVIGPYVIAVSSYPMWWGGFCPPARFLTPVVFPLAVAGAVWWSMSTGRVRALAVGLLVASGGITLAMTFGSGGWLAYNDADGSSKWIEQLTGSTRLSSYLPSFFRGHTPGATASDIRWPLVWSAVAWSAAATAVWLLLARWPSAGPAGARSADRVEGP